MEDVFAHGMQLGLSGKAWVRTWPVSLSYEGRFCDVMEYLLGCKARFMYVCMYLFLYLFSEGNFETEFIQISDFGFLCLVFCCSLFVFKPLHWSFVDIQRNL
jgi:hypothetical protein